MVIGYMKKNRGKLSVTAGTVGRGIKRSSGAVANCLGRLEKDGEVSLANKKPREYDHHWQKQQVRSDGEARQRGCPS